MRAIVTGKRSLTQTEAVGTETSHELIVEIILAHVCIFNHFFIVIRIYIEVIVFGFKINKGLYRLKSRKPRCWSS